VLATAVLCAGCGSSSSSGPVHLTGTKAQVAAALQGVLGDERAGNVAACQHVTLHFIQVNLTQPVHRTAALLAKCRSDVKQNASTAPGALPVTGVAITGSQATVSVKNSGSCGAYTMLEQNGVWKVDGFNSTKC
jgi:hypothetical protein